MRSLPTFLWYEENPTIRKSEYPGHVLERMTVHGYDVGGIVEAANYMSVSRVIDKEFPTTSAFVQHYDTMGSSGVGVNPDRLTEEEKAWLDEIEARLLDYPILDDQDYDYIINVAIDLEYENVLHEVADRDITIIAATLSEVKSLICSERLWTEYHIDLTIDWDTVFKRLEEENDLRFSTSHPSNEKA